MSQIKRFDRNYLGRDFAVGDIHGHFAKLQAALNAVNFAPAVDRLFSVGDLIDRGPESDQVEAWLSCPWFHAVRGNHEQLAIEAHRSDPEGNGNIQIAHMENGGTWLYGRSSAEISHLVDLLESLPIAIEVITPSGMVGIVHADCPYPTWNSLRLAFHLARSGEYPDIQKIEAMCQWSRTRITSENYDGVGDIRAVIVGHSAVRRVAVLGNVYHIDTTAWMGGHFTLINLATLECTPRINQKLEWDWDK